MPDRPQANQATQVDIDIVDTAAQSFPASNAAAEAAGQVYAAVNEQIADR